MTSSSHQNGIFAPAPAEAVVIACDDDELVSEATPLLPDKNVAKLTQNKDVIGLAFMALSALLFSAMSIFVKISGATIPFLQIVLARSLIQFVLGVAGCYYVGVLPWGPKGLRWWLLARGSAGATGLALYFYTLVNMPLGDGMTIFFTGPAFTAVLAHLTLGEPLTVPDVTASFLCIVGVVLVSRPTFLFPPHEAHGDSHTTAALAALAGAFMSAIAYCVVRKVGGRCHFMVHVTYFGVMSTLFSAIGVYCLESLRWWTLRETITMLGVGVTAFVAQCCLNKGLQLAHAGPASVMRNLDIVFAFIAGVLIFDELPTSTSMLGASLILACTVGLGLFKWQKGRR
ncbi:hypothetical protein HDU85_003214 [Gaertneriomyces sp. JEL0708]|nr:hypothetical protein HDU85_003214 [Gaertneriomyces sp. JEL0708]